MDLCGTLADGGGDVTEGRLKPSISPAASPYSKQFASVQKALWVGKPKVAESVLHGLLRKRLSRRDKARGAKTMGDA
jgi:hypothetical protein